MRDILRNIVIVIVVATLPAASAAAAPSGSQKPDKPANSGKLLPMKGASAGNACAAYGPGFVKVEGTETCVKIGGAVSIGVGSSSGSR
jgi:Porin subfamily